jgi:hypothetical protein
MQDTAGNKEKGAVGEPEAGAGFPTTPVQSFARPKGVHRGCLTAEALSAEVSTSERCALSDFFESFWRADCSSDIHISDNLT